jgi:AraC-like DNA-binding protein
MSTQAAVTILDIEDLTAANAGMDLLEQDGMSLQSAALRARRVIIRLESATVVYHATNLRVRVRSKVRNGLLAYVTFGPKATGTVQGFEVRPGMMVVAEPEIEAGFVADPGYESVALLVPPDEVRNHVMARQRADEFHWPRGVEILRADPLAARELFRSGKRLAVAASRTPALFDEGRSERDAAQTELLEALLRAMRTTDALDPVGKERTRQAYSQIVTIAENCLLANRGERVQLSGLCRAADVSERTLECAFKEITGLSPVAYLIRLRLHRVRAALLAAEPSSTQVSVEALKWGFWHFGEFSRAYKRCFGELPSDTLRRQSGFANRQGDTVASK